MIVDEVQARHIQISWNFARSFIWSNHDSPPNLSSCNSSMWAQLQILVCGQIFSLWSNYILYFFITDENLLEHDPDHITSLHQILAHLIEPISLNIFPNVLFSGKHCEGSTSFVYSNGMKCLQCLHLTKLSHSSKFQLHPFIYVSTSSNLWFY